MLQQRSSAISETAAEKVSWNNPGQLLSYLGPTPRICRSLHEAPITGTAEELRAIVDDALLIHVYRRRNRRYHNPQLGNEFEDGGNTWNSLVASIWQVFCRFVHIYGRGGSIPAFIDEGAGRRYTAIRTSTVWPIARCRNGEKLFLCFLYPSRSPSERVGNLKHGLFRPAGWRIAGGLGEQFEYELFNGQMGTTDAVVHWRASLANPRVDALYKTIVTYSLV